MHSGLGSPTRALVIEDIVSELNQFLSDVTELIETVFKFLFAKLDPIVSTVSCGIYKGRWYQREVAPTADLSFNSGRCFSRTWFEKEPGCECPLRQSCGAYKRAVDGDANGAQQDATETA